MKLPAVFARVRPPATKATPACMKKTSAAATSTQIVLVDEYIKSLLSILFSGMILFVRTNNKQKDAAGCARNVFVASTNIKLVKTINPETAVVNKGKRILRGIHGCIQTKKAG